MWELDDMIAILVNEFHGAAAAERPRSAAGAASVSYELPETNKAAPVCCSGWFGATTSAERQRPVLGG